jgi:two-component system, cell cycle response regulator
MNFQDAGLPTLTRLYVRLLHVLFALSPSVAIFYLAQFQDSGLSQESHAFHEMAIGIAIACSLFVAWITWHCYLDSGEPLLRWLTLGFIAFAVVYAPHGLFTSHAHEHPMLFLLYGPASRIILNFCLLLGVLSHGRAADPAPVRRDRSFWLRWLAAFFILDLLIAWLALSPAGSFPAIRMLLEGCALLIAVSALLLMRKHGNDLPLLSIYSLSLAMFAQSSLSFLLGTAWNHQWWLAHAISASGFLLLSYGVVRAFQTTRSFATVYSQETIIRQLESANERLTMMATTDSLTGIANRRHFFERAGDELIRASRSGKPLCLLALDIDHFKIVNDTYGHQAGDTVLRKMSDEINEILRGSDVFGRLGGEEFGILLPETKLPAAIAIAERIRRHIAGLVISHDTLEISITVSLGVAEFPGDGEKFEALSAAADRRLYAAKESGRNRVIASD